MEHLDQLPYTIKVPTELPAVVASSRRRVVALSRRHVLLLTAPFSASLGHQREPPPFSAGAVHYAHADQRRGCWRGEGEVSFGACVSGMTCFYHPFLRSLAFFLTPPPHSPHHRRVMKSGTEVVIEIFSVHREVLNWGDDANTFNPDRFTADLNEEGRWIPFSGGPRNCLGLVCCMTRERSSGTCRGLKEAGSPRFPRPAFRHDGDGARGGGAVSPLSLPARPRRPSYARAAADRYVWREEGEARVTAYERGREKATPRGPRWRCPC